MNKRELGSQQEEKAFRFLEEQGLLLVTRNYRKPEGEIDLIMRDGNTLVFVEVKYRKSTQYGHPYEAINWAKQRTIRKVAAIFLTEHEEYRHLLKRFDYVGIVGDQIQWIADAFS